MMFAPTNFWKCVNPRSRDPRAFIFLVRLAECIAAGDRATASVNRSRQTRKIRGYPCGIKKATELHAACAAGFIASARPMWRPDLGTVITPPKHASKLRQIWCRPIFGHRSPRVGRGCTHYCFSKSPLARLQSRVLSRQHEFHHLSEKDPAITESAAYTVRALTVRSCQAVRRRRTTR
jgi:hypothetical protein